MQKNPNKEIKKNLRRPSTGFGNIDGENRKTGNLNL